MLFLLPCNGRVPGKGNRNAGLQLCHDPHLLPFAWREAPGPPTSCSWIQLDQARLHSCRDVRCTWEESSWHRADGDVAGWKSDGLNHSTHTHQPCVWYLEAIVAKDTQKHPQNFLSTTVGESFGQASFFGCQQWITAEGRSDKQFQNRLDSIWNRIVYGFSQNRSSYQLHPDPQQETYWNKLLIKAHIGKQLSLSVFIRCTYSIQ